MDPFTISLIVGGVIALAKTGVGIGMNAKKSDQEKAMEQRLKGLKGQMATGQLGLSEKEQGELRASGNAAAQAAEREFMAREAERAAMSGATGGQLQREQLATQGMVQEQRAATQQQINVLDAQKKAQQEAEIQNLENTLLQMQQRRKELTQQAIMGGMDSAAGLAGAGMQSSSGQSISDEDILRAMQAGGGS